MTYGSSTVHLNIHDAELNVRELISPIKIDESNAIILASFTKYKYIPIEYACWIDICPTNSNLLAAAGTDRNIKIFDRREAKIVKIIDPNHSDNISVLIHDR